jgi:O-antigen/teichoic acid export membrane protein
MITSIIVFLLCLRIFLFLCKKYSLTGFWVNFNKIKEQSKKLFSFAFPVFLSGLVMTPALTILTALLSRLRGFQEVGFFNVGYSLTQIILFLPTAVGVPFIPIASRLASEDKERLKDFLLKTIYGVNIIVMLACFIMSFFANEIINLFYGPEYRPAQNIFLLLIITTFLSSFGYIIGYYLLAMGKVWLGTLMNFIWFTIILTPAYYLIKRWGLTGLGLTYFTSYTVLTILFCFYLSHFLQIKIGRLLIHLFVGTSFLFALFLLRSLPPTFWRITCHLPPILLEIGLFLSFVTFFIFLTLRTFDKGMLIKLFTKRNATARF